MGPNFVNDVSPTSSMNAKIYETVNKKQTADLRLFASIGHETMLFCRRGGVGGGGAREKDKTSFISRS